MAFLNLLNWSWKRGDLKKLFRVWFVVPILLFSGAPGLQAQTEISKEYQIKAVFLFNFAQFVTWPTNAFPDTQAPLTIGVLGDDPFDGFLDETVQGEKVNGHPLVIQRYRKIRDVKNCQILFISRSESDRLEQILADLKGKTILTVGDMDGFAKSGGVIRLVTEENKIHFRINLEAAKNADLTISSKMLRLAEIVEPGKD
jgi:hypothetical protein